MEFVFVLSNFGQRFATRERALQIREELAREAHGREVVIDFAGVTNVSYSFADEFLGKLYAESSVGVRVKNLSPQLATIANRAVERRAGVAVAS
jgi:anti-anti-sigma regulatory factor